MIYGFLHDLRILMIPGSRYDQIKHKFNLVTYKSSKIKIVVIQGFQQVPKSP